MANHIPTKTSFKKGHIRDSISIDKQSQTMVEQYRLGLRKHPIKPKGIKDKYTPIDCRICGKKYIPTSGRQRWCRECLPNNFYRRIYQRYGLDKKRYLELLTESGLCPICENRKATVVDHCHKTNKIRGIICNHCNTSLNLIENKEALERALKYVSIP